MPFLKRGFLVAALSLSATACLDLDVVNQNNPDIARALKDPADTEAVIASSFILWYNYFGSTDGTRVYPQIADELTTTITTRQFMWAIEPREAIDNNPQGEQVWLPRRPWDTFSACAANTNDGLKPIEGKNPDYTPREPMRILTADVDSIRDNTDRAVTFAKLMQGICHGFLALTNDQVATATEDTVVPQGFENQRLWERTHLKPYTQTAQMAISHHIAPGSDYACGSLDGLHHAGARLGARPAVHEHPARAAGEHHDCPLPHDHAAYTGGACRRQLAEGAGSHGQGSDL
jgi:hypothetical protein